MLTIFPTTPLRCGYSRPVFLLLFAGICFVASGQNETGGSLPAGVERRIIYLITKGDSALSQELTKEAVSYYQLADQDASSGEFQEYSLSLKIKLAQSYNKLSRYDEALSYLKQAEAHPLLPQRKEEQAKVYSLFGAVYETLGGFPQAFEYQLKALENREKMNDLLGIAESLYKIGSLFYYQKNYDKALAYYRESLVICENNPSISSKYLFNCLSALGSTYEEMNLGTKSLEYNLRSLDLAAKNGNDKNRAYALINVGENHTNLGNFAKAGACLKEALQLSRSLSIPRAEILSHQRIGELYLRQNRPKEAINALYQAYFLCRATGAKSLMVEVLEMLAQAHEADENYGAANTYLREYAVLKDSLLNETSIREISLHNTLYEVEKKENEIQLLQKERELLEVRKKADRLTNSGLISSLILLFLLSVWLSFWMVSQNRSNRTLKQLNARIEEQNRKLQSYNEELRQYAYVASHDLQEPLRTIGSFITIIKRRYTDNLDEQAHQYMNFVTDGVSRLQRMLKDLLSYTRIEREKTDFEWVESGEIVQFVISSLQQIIQETSAQITLDENALPAVYGNRSRLAQVFQNLIGNAIKFRAEAPPVVEIGCLTQPNTAEHIFYVKDNGIGIPEDFREKMFEMFTRLHSKEVYSGSGIGLATCRKIIENHGGRIWAESEPGMGSAMFFTLPATEQKSALETPAIIRAASILP